MERTGLDKMEKCNKASSYGGGWRSGRSGPSTEIYLNVNVRPDHPWGKRRLGDAPGQLEWAGLDWVCSLLSRSIDVWRPRLDRSLDRHAKTYLLGQSCTRRPISSWQPRREGEARGAVVMRWTGGPTTPLARPPPRANSRSGLGGQCRCDGAGIPQSIDRLALQTVGSIQSILREPRPRRRIGVFGPPSSPPTWQAVFLAFRIISIIPPTPSHTHDSFLPSNAP